MGRPATHELRVHRIRELARSGELRQAAIAAAQALRDGDGRIPAGARVELHLVEAFCAMRQGAHDAARRALDAARAAAAPGEGDPRLALRVATWEAELAYFEGRYSAASEALEALADRLEASGDPAYAAFALRVYMAIGLARADHGGVERLAPRALRLARASRDDYVRVQILNLLGAVCFDRATSKLQQPHVRAHLPALQAADAAAMHDDAQDALRLFEQAREVAEGAGYHFAAWYVAGNIERLEIVLGRAKKAVPAIRRRLKILQARGARYDELVARSNLAWALRSLGRHRDALHELDVSLELARETSTFNVMLEFIHYDRSVVLDALGDRAAARAAYRHYLRLASATGSAAPAGDMPPKGAPQPALEPFFLKRADRYVAEHLHEPLAIRGLARHCGVSWKTLEKAFADFRGVTPVAYVRNVRLDAARKALESGNLGVAEVAGRFGFGSATTFALEYRKRFGVPPSRTKRRAAAFA